MTNYLRVALRLSVLAALSSLLPPALAASTSQDSAQLKHLVQEFLTRQASGLPGEVRINVTNPDPRLNLPACVAPAPFLPPNGRLWGKTAVGVRCTAPAPWTVYVMANVQVIADYLVPATGLHQGQVIAAEDLAQLRGDLTSLPQGVLTDATDAIGRTATRTLQAGTPIRAAFLRSPRVVQQGQTVKVIAQGQGFSIASEARALSNGDAGQAVRARTPSGQVVSGLARAGGVIEVTF